MVWILMRITVLHVGNKLRGYLPSRIYQVSMVIFMRFKWVAILLFRKMLVLIKNMGFIILYRNGGVQLRRAF